MKRPHTIHDGEIKGRFAEGSRETKKDPGGGSQETSVSQRCHANSPCADATEHSMHSGRPFRGKLGLPRYPASSPQMAKYPTDHVRTGFQENRRHPPQGRRGSVNSTISSSPPGPSSSNTSTPSNRTAPRSRFSTVLLFCEAAARHSVNLASRESGHA